MNKISDGKKETVKHTPTPWRIADEENDQGNKAFIESETGIWIGEISSDAGIEEAKANATFIVRACNWHGALLNTIDDLIEHLDGVENFTDAMRQAIQEARRVIKQAEGRS